VFFLIAKHQGKLVQRVFRYEESDFPGDVNVVGQLKRQVEMVLIFAVSRGHQ